MVMGVKSEEWTLGIYFLQKIGIYCGWDPYGFIVSCVMLWQEPCFSPSKSSVLASKCPVCLCTMWWRQNGPFGEFYSATSATSELGRADILVNKEVILWCWPGAVLIAGMADNFPAALLGTPRPTWGTEEAGQWGSICSSTHGTLMVRNRSSDQFIPFGSSDFVPWLVPVVLAYPLALGHVLCCSLMSVRPIPLCHSFKHSVQRRAWVLGVHSHAVSAGALHPCPSWGCSSASFQTSVCTCMWAVRNGRAVSDAALPQTCGGCCEGLRCTELFWAVLEVSITYM